MMSSRRSWLRRAAAIAPLLLATVAVPTAASAAPSAAAGWHAVQDFPAGSYLDSVAGLGRNDAWLAGQSATNALDVWHWNGDTWAAVPTPTDITSSATTAVIAGSSASDVWTFTNLGNTYDNTVALHWNGTGWTPYRLAEYSGITAVSVFSDTDAWAFGLVVCCKGTQPYVLHFDGSKWHRVATPIVTDDASAVSANDIWAVGQTVKSLKSSQPAFALAQWTKGSWHEHAFPNLKLAKGVGVNLAQVVALSKTSVWVDCQLFKGEGLHPGAVLLHYNGKTWTRVSVPYSSALTLTNLAADGTGGIWIGGLTASGVDQYVYRLDAGRWSRTTLPSPAGDITYQQAIAFQPGTSSSWAAAITLPKGGGTTQGVLLQYQS